MGLNIIGTFGIDDSAAYRYLLCQSNLRRWQKTVSVALHQMDVALNVTCTAMKVSFLRRKKRGLPTAKSQPYQSIIVTLTDNYSQTGYHLEHTSGLTSGTHYYPY